MADERSITESASDLATRLQELSDSAAQLAAQTGSAIAEGGAHGGEPFLVTGLTVFVLACFVGYHVVWRVTPALHSPLMGITNAISSVIIVGAILAVGPSDGGFSKLLGFFAVMLASVNIFGGFIITRRMLGMFKKKG
ncbi:MAG: NAD(P) transhydrogenase subunit alpha [Alphaproteobacteria bacterium]|nr:NAD(P) transhydrogenase subunit alpha [Alphaproteobacteria bacterium]